MSKIGKKLVNIPSGVNIKQDGNHVQIAGKNGEVSYQVPETLSIELVDGNLALAPKADDKNTRMIWGTTRSNLSNIVIGLSEGFTVELEINGVGYRAAVQGTELVMSLGYSHEVKFAIPEGVTIQCPKPTSIIVSGANKQQVGQVSAIIRSYRPPEPYKGKGIKYAKEHIVRKEGKKK